MPKVFNLLSPRTPWRLFLYFVNNLKTVGCYCGVCRRCGFLPSGVHGAENRRSHVCLLYTSWILSRTPRLPSRTLNHILRLAEARGYRTGKLLFVDQGQGISPPLP